MIRREDSLRIKGVTILFMIAFHLFGFPQRLPIDGSAWMGSPIIKALQICVPIFLFLSGYGLQSIANNTHIGLPFILKRMKKLYLGFWSVFIPFISLGLAIGYYRFEWQDFVYNLLGITSTYNHEWWFFSLYIELLLVFYLLCKLHIKNYQYVLLMILILIVSRYLNNRLIIEGYEILTRHIKMVLIDVNIFMLGCYFAKYEIYQKIFSRLLLLKKFHYYLIIILFFISPLLVRAFLPYIGITELILVPLFCYSITMASKVSRINFLLFFGKHSMNLWLIHTFFIYYFCKAVTFLTTNSIVMLLTAIGCSLLCSWGIEYLKDKLSPNTIK